MSERASRNARHQTDVGPEHLIWFRKKYCQQQRGESLSRKDRETSHCNMLCCTPIANELFKLSGRTENKCAITRPKLLSFTLNKLRLITWLVTRNKQSRVYTPLQKTRGIFLSNRGLQTNLNPTLVHGGFAWHHTEPAFSDMGIAICNKPPYFNNS